MKKYTCTDGNADIEIEANSATDAAREYVEGGDWGGNTATTWVDVRVTPIIEGPTKEQIMQIIEGLACGNAVDFDDSITLTVAEDYDIDDVKSALPLGASCDWSGTSNTDASGETTEDIRIEWEDEVEDEDNSQSITITIDADEPDCEHEDGHDWQSPIEVVGGLRENPGVHGNGGGVIITEVCAHCGAYRITNTWAQRSDTGEQGLRSIEYRDADESSLAWVESLR